MSPKCLLFVVLLSVAIAGTTFAQSCPPAEELLPCECDEERLRFYCSDPALDLKAVFDRVSPFINDSVVFDDILITGIDATEIPANTMVSLKFRQITIEYNFKLAFIHEDAFPGTYNTTTELTIARNKLLNQENPHDIYNFVSKFINVERVTMHQNNLLTIPSDPFTQVLPKLVYLQLGSAGFYDIGSRIFANLPSLEYVVMGYCDISINEFKNDTFEGIGPNAVVNLEHNPFSRVPEEIFRPVLENAKELRVGGEDCYFIWCTNVPFDCDEQADWICQNAASYEQKIAGFYCRDGNPVWNYCQNKSV